MKAAILVENTARVATTFLAEHGFSLYLEDQGIRVLYDTGKSDVFIKNAEKLNIDLTQLDYVIISHGHADHSGGMRYLIDYYRKKMVMRKPVLLMTEPRIFLRRRALIDRGLGGVQECSFEVDQELLEQYFDVRFEPGVRWLTPNLVYLGKPERNNDFEGKVPQVPKILMDGTWQDDLVDEDTQLAYVHQNREEISIFSGCSHSGLCNIIEFAKKVTGSERVHTFLGGMHLQAPPDWVMEKTKAYIASSDIRQFYACHDIDWKSKLELIEVSNFKDCGAGTQVELI